MIVDAGTYLSGADLRGATVSEVTLGAAYIVGMIGPHGGVRNNEKDYQ